MRSGSPAADDNACSSQASAHGVPEDECGKGDRRCGVSSRDEYRETHLTERRAYNERGGGRAIDGDESLA